VRRSVVRTASACTNSLNANSEPASSPNRSVSTASKRPPREMVNTASCIARRGSGVVVGVGLGIAVGGGVGALRQATIAAASAIATAMLVMPTQRVSGVRRACVRTMVAPRARTLLAGESIIAQRSSGRRGPLSRGT